MTSNGEREFPPAFLRRCLRLDIKLTKDTKALKAIVQAHLGQVPNLEIEPLIDRAIRDFSEKTNHLAIDQLLNLVHLLIQNPTMDYAKVRDAILRPPENA